MVSSCAIKKPNGYIYFFPFQNEINEVPFFDVQLPYELALKIFQYLGKAELGRCAQVSTAGSLLPLFCTQWADVQATVRHFDARKVC